MRATERHPAAQRYDTIIVIGGGCYGSYYVRQLRRARSAGALAWERVLVVDRDPACRVARHARESARERDAIELVIAAWETFLSTWLADAARAADARADAIVPSPLMPHLLFEWVMSRARERWPDRRVERGALDRAPDVPWQRVTPGSTHYVSFAEWTCPVNCIEPRRCPVTRGPRDWSLPPAVRAYADEERQRGHAIVGPLLFHCTHRAYGVGMIDARDVLEADRLVASAGTSGPARVLIGTTSHCHGALDVLTIAGAGECACRTRA